MNPTYRGAVALACWFCLGCGDVESDPPERRHWIIAVGAEKDDGAVISGIDGTDVMLSLYSDSPLTLGGTKLPLGHSLLRLDSSGRPRSAHSLAPERWVVRCGQGDWLQFGSEPDPEDGQQRLPFIRRFDASWKQLWTWGEHLGHGGYVSGEGCDAQGDVFVLGRHGYETSFVTKLDASGTPAWELPLGDVAGVTALAVSGTGDFAYERDVLSDSPMPTWTQTLERRDTEGKLAWQLQREFADTQAVLADDLGRTFVVSECTPEDSFDPDLCIWSFDSSGQELWQQRLHDPAVGFVHQTSSLYGQRLLLTAVPTLEQLAKGLVLFELDSHTGEVRSTSDLATGEVDSAYGLAALDGDLVLAGAFYGVLSFGIGTLQSHGLSDAFAAKLPWDPL